MQARFLRSAIRCETITHPASGDPEGAITPSQSTAAGFYYKWPLIETSSPSTRVFWIWRIPPPRRTSLLRLRSGWWWNAFCAANRVRTPLRFPQTVGSIDGRHGQLSTLLTRRCGAVWVEAHADPRCCVTIARTDSKGTRQSDNDARQFGITSSMFAFPPRLPAGAEQPGGLSRMRRASPSRGCDISAQGKRAAGKSGYEPNANPPGAGRGSDSNGGADSRRGRRPSATGSSPTPYVRDPPSSAFNRSFRLTKRGLRQSDTLLVISPTPSDFLSRFFSRSERQSQLRPPATATKVPSAAARPVADNVGSFAVALGPRSVLRASFLRVSGKTRSPVSAVVTPDQAWRLIRVVEAPFSGSR